MQNQNYEKFVISGLQYLAANTEELEKFLAITGFSPQDMRKQASSDGFNIAILEFFVNHEPTLLAFSASCGYAPQEVVKAYQALGGTNECQIAGGY